MSKYIKRDLLERHEGISKDKLDDIFSIIGDFGSDQMFFEVEKFIEYYNGKYNNLDKTLDKILDILKNCSNEKEFIFYSKKKNENKEKIIKKEKDIYNASDEFTEGIFTCKKCGSKRIIYNVSYTRSADEPPVVLFKCQNAECMNVDRVG